MTARQLALDVANFTNFDYRGLRQFSYAGAGLEMPSSASPHGQAISPSSSRPLAYMKRASGAAAVSAAHTARYFLDIFSRTYMYHYHRRAAAAKSHIAALLIRPPPSALASPSMPRTRRHTRASLPDRFPSLRRPI